MWEYPSFPDDSQRQHNNEEGHMGLADEGTGGSSAEGRIEIRLHKMQQLFNSFDPSPFISKDLDDEAEAYIVDSLAELPHARSAELVIHLPQAEVELRTATDLAEAIHGYFGYRQGVTRHKLRALFRIGRTSLLIGLVFLAVCTLLSEAVSRAEWPSLGNLLEQGLLITGWVANWRPLEIFLYDWWPLSQQARLYGILSRIPVRILAS
jgi:hypothetical protein